MNTLKLNILKMFTKEELKSAVKTFIAMFIPQLILILQSVDTENLTVISLTSLGVAIWRSIIKVLWDILTPIAVKFFTIIFNRN
jgi:uncharacterized protein with PQ loop repeat